MVERTSAAKIRRQWVQAGSPPCDHPKLSPEYDNGSPTGHQVCRRCGRPDVERAYSGSIGDGG